MKTIEAWHDRWFGPNIKTLLKETVETLKLQQAELLRLQSQYEGMHAALTGVIQELNTVRNSIPAAQAAAAQHGVRVFRHWGEFRATLENKPIEVKGRS